MSNRNTAGDPFEDNASRGWRIVAVGMFVGGMIFDSVLSIGIAFGIVSVILFVWLVRDGANK